MLLDRLILEELRRAPAHGYVLTGALRRRGADVAPSSVYRALRRLERDGMLSARWQDGKRRRIYRTTRAGNEVAQLWRLEVRSIARR